MSERAQTSLIVVLLLASVAVASAVGRNITELRESGAFFQWIISAATNERMFESADAESYSDRELFDRVADRAELALPGATSPGVRKITAYAADVENEQAIFDFASSSDAADLRRDFLDQAAKGRLEFAKGIAYADAQASGVGVLNLFFGFRKVAATFVWLQVDRYWHQGDMHRMIPLMKTCVTLDPNFVDAYLLGAWHLAYNVTAHMPETAPAQMVWSTRYQACMGDKERFYYIAADFLKDGIRNNPRNYKLYFDLGFGVYNQKMKDYPNAVRYLEEAVRQPHERWVPRMLYRTYELNGDHERAIAGWEDYKERFRNSDSATATEVAPRMIARNTALLNEKKATELRLQAAETDDPTEAARLRAEAKDYFEIARATYTEINEPFAVARLLRMEALDFVEEGRYREALAKLEQARWENPGGEFFFEISNLMIDIKQRAGIPLSVSEQKAVVRNEVGTDCQGKPAAVEAAA